MTVYVDDMLRPARVGNIRAKWSHLFADSTAELLETAAALGLRPEWIQHPGTYREHFDVTQPKRARAIGMGAVQITYPHGTGRLLAAKSLAMAARTVRPRHPHTRHPEETP